MLNYANYKLLLPGANETESLKLLLVTGGFKGPVQRTNALLAPHHRRTSAFYNKLFEYNRAAAKIG